MRTIPCLVLLASLTGCATTPEQDAAIGRLGQALLMAGSPQQQGYYQAQPQDYDFAWDQFYHNNILVWACRGKQTGRFHDTWRCNGRGQNDFTWPGPY